MWPFVRPIWFRALISVLICIPVGSLDAIIALSLKPYTDIVMVGEKYEFAMVYPAFNHRIYLSSGGFKLFGELFKYLGFCNYSQAFYNSKR